MLSLAVQMGQLYHESTWKSNKWSKFEFYWIVSVINLLGCKTVAPAKAQSNEPLWTSSIRNLTVDFVFSSKDKVINGFNLKVIFFFFSAAPFFVVDGGISRKTRVFLRTYAQCKIENGPRKQSTTHFHADLDAITKCVSNFVLLARKKATLRLLLWRRLQQR